MTLSKLNNRSSRKQKSRRRAIGWIAAGDVVINFAEK